MHVWMEGLAGEKKREKSQCAHPVFVTVLQVPLQAIFSPACSDDYSRNHLICISIANMEFSFMLKWNGEKKPYSG